MDIQSAKQQVKDTVEAYLAKDEDGLYIIDPTRQRPLFLLGAPGIGKTAIMGQIAHELGIGLVAYSMTHHTRQSALGLPKIVHEEFEGMEYDASEYTMSEIIASVYDYMRTTGLRQGILFLDEVNCVSETLYPSMLQFLQFKTFGKHRVPDDWVVVCAGNPPEYNKSVHEFDIVTLDRLRRIEIEPEYAAWKRYAQETGTHPAITSYLEVRHDDFYSVETKPGSKSFVTARGWSDLSEVMLLFEAQGKPVNGELIGQFLQDKGIAERFAVYYDLFNKYRSDYQIDRILAGDAPDEIVERGRNAAFDERMAIVGLLLDVIDGRMTQVTFEEEQLVALRDILRATKPAIVEGGDVRDVLGACIAEQEGRVQRALERSGNGNDEVRLGRRTVAALKDLVSRCALEGACTGPEAFAIVNDAFSERASQLEPSVDAVEGMLANAYAYVDAAFQDDREGTVFTAELTARKGTSRFLNRFGSKAYFEHNEGVMVNRHRQDLFARIDAAGLGDAPAASIDDDGTPDAGEQVRQLPDDDGAPGAGEQVCQADLSAYTVPENIDDYYAQSQFEFGLASLCKMTLPEGLEGKTVLDIGCRRGRGVFKLSDRVGNDGRAIGVEWAPAFVEEAQERMERAWRDSGLSHNNMEFHLGYPEDLGHLGIKDDSVDLIYVNAVSNLAFDPESAFSEMARVLKPGGTVVCETVFASGKRNPDVVRAARAVGNSVQAAPSKQDFERMLGRVGFASVEYSDEHPVRPEDGALPERPADVVPVDEDVSYTALVATIRKGLAPEAPEGARFGYFGTVME